MRVSARSLSAVALGLVTGCLVAPPAGLPPRAPTVLESTAVLWPGKRVGELYQVGEVRAFAMTQGDHPLGTSWGRYAGVDPDRPQHHVFETRIELTIPGRPPVRSDGRLVLDEAGQLVDGFERSDIAELRFARRDDVITLTDGRSTDEIGYEPQRRDVAVMAHSAILHEELMLGLRALHEGHNEWRLVSLSGGPPTEWEGEAQPVGDAVRLLTTLGELVVVRDGRIERIEVDATSLKIEPVRSPSWPTWSIAGPTHLAYQPPMGARFVARELELPGRPGEPALAGEVLVPTDASPPFAGVVFVSGTGQTDRYGFSGPPQADLGSHEMTDALANAGFLVLRFDERGQGDSEAGELSFSGQIEDARRALRTLLVQDEVDPDRIVLVGHGEGGLRALHVAAGRDEVKGVALLASPGRPYREVFLQQAALALDRVPPELRGEAEAEQARMLAALESGRDVPPELAPQAIWIREMLQQKPAALIAATRARLLLAQGGKDFEIDPQADLDALVRAARRSKLSVRVERYPDLDHLFKLEPDGSSSPARYLERGRPVDPEFIADLVDWARSVVGRKPMR